MSAKQKKKLCWNCEGNSPITEENCPYCGVYLSQMTFGNDHQSHESLYPSSKKIENKPLEGIDKESNLLPGGFYTSEIAESLSVKEPIGQFNSESKSLSSAGMQFIVLPLSLLLSGSVFALFSLSMFLFSHEGTFTLQWSSHYWYLYLFVSFILLGLGFWKLESLD